MRAQWTGRFADEVRQSRARAIRAMLQVEPTAVEPDPDEPEKRDLGNDTEDEGA